MHLRRTARTSALALALVAGLTVPPAAWSTTDPPPQTQPEELTELELAEELGHEVGSPELDEAVAKAEVATQTAAALGTTADEPEVDVFAQESETGLWIVQLEGEPLATCDGGVRSLSATSTEATGQERLDVGSTRSRAYLSHLQDEHDSALSAMTAEVGHEVEVTQPYHHVLNGMTVRASAEEAAAYAELPGVARVAYPG